MVGLRKVSAMALLCTLALVALRVVQAAVGDQVRVYCDVLVGGGADEDQT